MTLQSTTNKLKAIDKGIEIYKKKKKDKNKPKSFL
jgi:hypothetical protein